MSALIKAEAGAIAGVIPFGVQSAQAMPKPPTQEQMLGARIAALEADIAEAELKLPELLTAAREDGARQARDEMFASDASKLELIAEAAEQALAGWNERLKSIEGAAVALSASILERVFGEESDRTQATTSALRRTMADLEAASVIRVRVSPEDFADEDQLAALCDERTATVIDGDLKSGECVIDLKLGHIDVGPMAQWRGVRRYLERLEQAQ